nr:uncharacterized protein LOC128685280 [Cherax quadricarinatus]
MSENLDGFFAGKTLHFSKSYLGLFLDYEPRYLIHGIIAANCVGIEAGVQNAVHPRYRSLAKAGVRLYCKCADLSSIYEAQKFALTTPCNAPAMYIHSMADQVALFPHLEPVICAQEKVSPVTTFIIPKEEQVPHVTIMRHLGEHKYMGLIDKFVEKYRGFVSSGSQKNVASISSENAPSSERIILSL